MPQLDHTVFMSQVFWLILLFMVLYIVSNVYILPTISAGLKVRQKKLQEVGSNVDNLQEEEAKVLKEYDNIVVSSLQESRKVLSDLIDKSNAWLDSEQKKINGVDLKNLNTQYLNAIGKITAQKYILENLIK